MRHISVFILFVFISIVLNAEADFSINFRKEFKLTDKKDKIKLTSNTEKRFTFLTKESLDIKNFYVSENFYSPIKKIAGGYCSNLKHDQLRWIKSSNKSWQFFNSSDIFSSDYKLHQLYFPQKRKIGDQIVLTYEEEFWELAYLPVIEINDSEEIETYVLEFDHPQNYEINFEVFFPRDEYEFNVSRPDENKTIFSIENLEDNTELDYFFYNGLHSMIFIKIFKDDQEITPFNLDSFVQWYSKQVDLNPKLPMEQRGLLITEIKESNSNKENLKIIYEYVRDNYRYIASHEDNHSFFPRDINEIIEKGYGDCKDKAYLLKAIAANYGIKVDLALLNSSTRPDIDYYHFSLYDHVICSYTDSTGTIFMDATGKYCHFGNLPSSDQERNALIIDEENPREQWIPKPNNEYDAVLKISANIDSMNACNATITLFNDDYIFTKAIYEKCYGLEFENELSNYLSPYFYKISLDYFKFEKESENSITFKNTADLSEFVISTQSKKYLQRTPFYIFDKDFLKRSEDDYDIHINRSYKLKLVIELESIDFVVKSNKLMLGNQNKDYFESTISRQSDAYILDYDFCLCKQIYTKEEKKAVIDLARKYLSNKKNMIIMEREES